jgi:NitT/TauT family transport system substrate-binding protein
MWLLGGFAAAGLSLLPQLADAADKKITMELDWQPWGHHSFFFLAKQKGWYAEKGLDVEIRDGAGSDKAIILVANGEIQFAHASLFAMMVAKDKGVPVKSVGQIYRKSEMGMLVPADGKIKSIKDLEGKTVVATAGWKQQVLETVFKNGGADPAKITVKKVTSQAKDALYASGEADAVDSQIPGMLPTVNPIRKSIPIHYSDFGVPFPSLGLIAREDFIKANPDIVRAFVEVFFRAQTYAYNGNQDESVDALIAARPHAKLNKEILRGHLDAYREYVHTAATQGQPLGWHPPQDWAQSVKVALELGIIKNQLKLEDLYSNEFLSTKPGS